MQLLFVDTLVSQFAKTCVDAVYGCIAIGISLYQSLTLVNVWSAAIWQCNELLMLMNQLQLLKRHESWL